MAIGVDVVVFRTYSHIACGQDGVGIIDRANHVHQAKLMRLQLYRINIDLNLPVFTAKRLRYGCSWHVSNLVANRKLPQVVQLRLIHSFALQGNQADRQTGSVELEHDWRQRTRRQAPQLRHRQIRDAADGCVGVGTRLKIDLDETDSSQRPRFDMVDTTPQREKSLERVGNVSLNLLRGHPGIECRHHNHGNIDVGEEIHRHTRDGRYADNHDDQA